MAELDRADGVLVPGGFGSRGWEGKVARLPRGARARDPVPRDLPRHARRGVGVRAARLRDGRRQLDRDGPGDAVPRDRPAAGAEGGRGSRRDDAARCPGGGARRGHPRPGDLRRLRDPRAPPAPLRGQQPVPGAARPTRASSSRGRSRRAGSSRSSSCRITPGSSRASSTPSSSRARPGRRRSSASSSAAALERRSRTRRAAARSARPAGAASAGAS